jgi:5-hydroxyisourate hydrolase
MGTITTHVLDLAAGIPAAGVLVELHECSTIPARLVASRRTTADGRCPEPLIEGAYLRTARYSLTFHVAAYFRGRSVQLSEPPFLDKVVIEFGVADPAQNYHVPLLVSPWSYSSYRGS